MIKIIVSFILVGIITLNSNFLWAKEELSLNSLIEQALKENPQLQAAKFRLEAAKARVRLLRTLEDPRFEYEYNKIIPGMISGATGENMSPMRMFSVSQEIPFPSKLFLRKKSAEKEANSFEQEYKETERKVIQEVKEAYFEIFLSHKKIAITKENLGLLKQFVEIANRKYSVNKASQQDSLKAQVEYSKLSNQLILLEQEEQISQARLKSLLSQPQESAYIKVEEESSAVVELSEEKIIKLTKDKRPELKAYSEMSRKAEIDLALAKQEYLPDFMVKYTREERNGSAGAWSGMFGATFPLWFWEKQNSFVKEASANVSVAKAEYSAVENMVLFEARSAYAKFQAAKNLAKIYETGVLPQAQAALETARLGYEADKIEFLDLLDAQRTLREFQMDYFEALANTEIALADLERSVGTGLLQ